MSPVFTNLIAAIVALIVVVTVARIADAHLPATGRAQPIVGLILGLIAVGICLWLINTYIPMANSIKTILNIVVVAAVCVWVLKTAGLWDPLVGMWNRLIERVHSTEHHEPPPRLVT